MDITITNSESSPPVEFANSLTMTIKSFKGRRNVDVHLFRSRWETSLERTLDWSTIIQGDEDSTDTSRKVVMESFSTEERDRIVNYLKEQYSTRLTAIRSTPLSFPVPAGLPGLSQLQPDKNVGLIDFESIPSYSLDIPLKGLYDLSQHPPIVQE